LGSSSVATSEWIKKSSAPDLSDYMYVREIGGQPGPWIALDGFVSQHDESRGRRLFAFVRSFLVPKDEAEEFALHLTKQPLGNHWLPEKTRSIYTFVGEVPWCDTFRKTHRSTVEFVVSEKKVKLKRKQPSFFLDGNPLDLTAVELSFLRQGLPINASKKIVNLSEADFARITVRNEMVEVEKVEQEFRKFKVLSPVHEMGWEGRKIDNIPIHGNTLAKQLAQSLGLVNLPQTYDLQTKEGTRATYGIEFQPQNYNNSERFFFIRKVFLRMFLQKFDLSLVWAIWGERGLSNKQLERVRDQKNFGELNYADFKSIHRLKFDSRKSSVVCINERKPSLMLQNCTIRSVVTRSCQ
jgi:hypothetical protein